MDTVEELIETLFEDEFISDLYSASIAILDESENPLHFNFFCLGVREMLRVILHEIAPLEKVSEVKYCEFTEKGYPTKFTQLKYSVLKDYDQNYFTDSIVSKVDSSCRELSKIVSALSKFVHLDENRFDLDVGDVSSEKEKILDSLLDFLQHMQAARNLVFDDVATHLNESIFGQVIENTIDEIDELATHHLIEEVYFDDLSILEFSKDKISIEGTGSIYVKLQYGSNSDVNKGDGLVTGISFPFSSTISGSPQDIRTLEMEGIKVDTSKFYE